MQRSIGTVFVIIFFAGLGGCNRHFVSQPLRATSSSFSELADRVSAAGSRAGFTEALRDDQRQVVLLERLDGEKYSFAVQRLPGMPSRIVVHLCQEKLSDQEVIRLLRSSGAAGKFGKITFIEHNAGGSCSNTE